MMLALVKRACRTVLRAALEVLGPDPGERPRSVSIDKVEICVGSGAKPGDVARQVAEQIAGARRYRRGTEGGRSAVRAQRVALMMATGEWNGEPTALALAKEYGVEPSEVQQYATRAASLLRDAANSTTSAARP